MSDLSVNEIELLLSFAKASNDNASIAITNSLLETEQGHKAVIALLNNLLKSPKSHKEDVYAYLNTIVFCISKENISENIVFWIQNVADHNKCNKMPVIWYTVISNLIRLGKGNPDFNKLMISSHLFKIIDFCLSVNLKESQAQTALSCLALCLEEYPQSCTPLKQKIEFHLLQCISLQTNNLKLIKIAAVCFLKLQKIGNPGPDNKNHLNNWGETFERLCVTLDSLYDNFFESVEEFSRYEKPDIEPYQLPDTPKMISSTETLKIIEMRLDNICVFLRGMLENEFTTAKRINSQYVFDVISRALSLHTCVNSSDNLLHFSVHLMNHQIAILYVLRSIIASFELSLLPCASGIEKLLLDCLARTKKCKCFDQASQYKEVIYKVFEYLIKIFKNSLNSKVPEKLINLILDDISPITTDVSLSITNLNSVSRKKEKKLMQEKVIASTTRSSNGADYSKNYFNAKDRVCYEALSCLSTLLNHVNISAEESNIKRLYTTLRQAILSLHYGAPPLPYNNVKIQIKLYETLIATLECSKPPSICLIVNLLKDGENNSNTSISLMCTMGLSLIEKIAQPSVPSWNFVKLRQSTSSPIDKEVEFMIEDDPILEECVEEGIDAREEIELGNSENIVVEDTPDSPRIQIHSIQNLDIPEHIVIKLSNTIHEDENTGEYEPETDLDKTFKLCDSHLYEEENDDRIEEDTETSLEVDMDIENTRIQAGDVYTDSISDLTENEPSTSQPSDNEEITVQKHSVDDFGESARKKSKYDDHSPDIDEMLESFVDERAKSSY